jgi:hypothetical protein
MEHDHVLSTSLRQGEYWMKADSTVFKEETIYCYMYRGCTSTNHRDGLYRSIPLAVGERKIPYYGG